MSEQGGTAGSDLLKGYKGKSQDDSYLQACGDRRDMDSTWKHRNRLLYGHCGWLGKAASADIPAPSRQSEEGQEFKSSLLPIASSTA